MTRLDALINKISDMLHFNIGYTFDKDSFKIKAKKRSLSEIYNCFKSLTIICEMKKINDDILTNNKTEWKERLFYQKKYNDLFWNLYLHFDKAKYRRYLKELKDLSEGKTKLNVNDVFKSYCIEDIFENLQIKTIHDLSKLPLSKISGYFNSGLVQIMERHINIIKQD